MNHPHHLKWLNVLLLPAAISSLSVFSTQAVAVNALHSRVLDTRAVDTKQAEALKPSILADKTLQVTPVVIVDQLSERDDLIDVSAQYFEPTDSGLEADLGSDLLVMSQDKSEAEPEQMVDSDNLVSDSSLEAQATEVSEKEEPIDGDAFDFGDQPEVSSGSDPLRFINKPINSFNSALDKAVLRPTAKAYQKVTPAPVRSGVRNFFKNLREPWTAVNLMLQGKPADSAKSLGRFTLNTVTTLGFVDVSAKYQGLSIPKEDLGQTLAVWGVPNGPYIVLPLLGPSTLRDTAGLPFDSAAYPPAYLQDDAAVVGVTAADGISLRAELLSIDGLVDPYDYELLKSVYLQNRAYEISRSGSAQEAEQESFASEGFGD